MDHKRWLSYAQNQAWAAAVARRRKTSKDASLLQASLRAWRDAHVERRALFARFMIPPSRATRLASYMSRWRVNAGALRRDAHLVHVFALRRRAHVTSEAFWRWCYITAEMKMHRAQLDRAERKARGTRRRTVRMALSQWWGKRRRGSYR